MRRKRSAVGPASVEHTSVGSSGQTIRPFQEVVVSRKVLHLSMTLALVACIASLVDSSSARTRPCPLCGGPAELCGIIHSLSMDRKIEENAHTIYRCRACEYEVVEPASSDVSRLPQDASLAAQ
jgi:hypothetical protein